MRKCAMVMSGLMVLLSFYAMSYGESPAPSQKGFTRSICVHSILYGKPTWQEAYNVNEEKIIKHLKELHINTTILYAWGSDSITDRKGFDVGRFLRAAEKHGIRVIVFSLATCYTNFEGLPDDLWKSERPGKGKRVCLNKPVVRKYLLDKCRDLGYRYGKHPALLGMLEDEPALWAKTGYCRYCREKFQKWLKKNYPERLASKGIDVSKVTVPPDMKKSPFLHNAYQMFTRDAFISRLGEMAKSFKKAAPGKKYTVCFSSVYEYRRRPLQGSLAFVGRVADILDGEFGSLVTTPKAAYWYELASSAIEHWACYHFAFIPIGNLKLGTWEAVMHADGVECYTYRGLYQDMKPMLGMGTDGKKVKAKWYGRDPKLGMIPEKVKAFKEVFGDIAKCDSYIAGVKTAATIAIGVKELDYFHGHSGHYASAGAGQALYEFFVQEHITSAPFFVENITAKSLARSKILLLPNCRSLSDKEAGIIRNWVSNGGVLLASKETSSKDELGLDRKDYALKDVFGASATDGKIKATKAKVIEKVGDVPAILSNDYGKGRCYLFLDGLNSYAKGEKSALLKKILDSGMKKSGARYPLLITKGGDGIETNVRERIETRQLIRVLYLLKVKDTASTSGIEARLEVPSGYKVKGLIAPISGKELTYKEKDGYVVFNMPSFELYEAVVLLLVKG